MIMPTIYYIVTAVAVALLIIAAVRRERVQIYEDGIKIKDLLYPLTIPNDTIVSISLVDRLPSLMYRTNGTGLGLIQKGYFKVKNSSLEHSENATLYIRNRNTNAIKIRTVKGLVYINQNTDELTQNLFNEMKSTVKILKENELNVDAKRPRTYRSIIVIAVFFMVLLVPTLFMNYSNEIIVNDDAIEIKGEYSMNINMNDIDTVMLVNNLPPIKIRTNGISTGKVNIGNFKMSDDNTCRLYVNKDVDMFIEIKLNAQCSQPEASMIFINKQTVEETESLYEEIYNLKY